MAASRRSSTYGLPSSAGQSPSIPASDADRLLAKERECDQLTDQLESLQRQLAGRPPKAELDSLRSEFRIQEGLLSGFQRENEKAEREVGRLRSYARVLETELARLQGPTWAATLDLPSLSSTASSFGSPSTSLAGSAPGQSSPSTSRQHTVKDAASHQRSRLGQETFIGRGGASAGSDAGGSAHGVDDRSNESADDDSGNEEEQTSSGDEVEGAIFSPVKKARPRPKAHLAPRPSSTSSPLSRRSNPFGPAPPAGLPSTPDAASSSAITLPAALTPALVAEEGKAVRRLLLGMEGRLSTREAELTALVEKAELQAATWRQHQQQLSRPSSAVAT